MRPGWNLRVIVLIPLLLASFSSVANTIRIMPWGDYDTIGGSRYVSFRYDLWLMLVDAGFDVNFVGGKQRASTVFPDLYPRLDEFDADYEGEPILLISEMVSQASELVRANRPHVVHWQSTEDICNAGANAGVIVRSRLPEMIALMRAENPNLHFVLATAIDWSHNSCGDVRLFIPAFNQAIADVAAAEDTPQSRVVVADHYTGYDRDTMYEGWLFRSNRVGEMFLASRSFAVLADLLPTIEVEESNFVINSGLNDAWFNPATAGQGFFVTVFPDIEMMFLAWFTYDTARPDASVQASLGEPGHRWLTAFGPYEGNSAELEVELTSGGVFDAANPAPQSSLDGTITVEFDGCNAAIVSYDIISAGVMGEIPIERIAPDNVALCEALAD